VFSDEDKFIIKFLREYKRIDLEQSEKFVAYNLNDRTVNAFY